MGGTYTVTASGGASGNPVTFSIDPSAKGSCSISGATVTFVAVGTCVIDANQAGNANYEAATQVQQSFAVLGTQSITFTSTPPSPAVVGGTYTVTASGGASGNPVTFSIDASAKGSCSISGATVTFVAVGTCVIDANQAGNANYEAATQVQQSFAVLGTQSITFTSTPPSPAVVGGTYTVTASGGASGNPVTFSIDPSANGSLQHLGCHRHLRRRRDLRHRRQPGRQRQLRGRHPGPAVLRRSSVPRVISFTSTPPSSAVVGGTYTPTASGGASGNPVTFSIDPSAKGSCSISGATVTFVAVGTCVIDANQAGNASYEAATQVQQSFAVGASGSTPPSGANCTSPAYTTTNYEGTYNTDPGVGQWWINNDVWSPNAVTPPTQTLQVCSQSSWNAIAKVTAASGNGVQSYPSTEYDVGGRDSSSFPSTKPISAYTSITSTFSEAFPTTGDSFDSAYDLWTDNWSHETMIWNQYGGTQAYAATYAPNTPVTLDGVAYHFHLFGGIECIFTRDTQVSSGSVDILAAYQWEVANGYAKATDAPTQLEYGIDWSPRQARRPSR